MALARSTRIFGTFRIASFDIGDVNFGTYVEKCPLDKIQDLYDRYHALPKKFQRRIKGPMNPHIRSILDETFLCGQREFTEVANLRGEQPTPQLTMQTRRNLIDYLDSRREQWEGCDVVVIEQQYLSFAGRGKKSVEANFKAIKISEDVAMWFLINYPDAEVMLFSSANKTHMLGAPVTIKTKPQRKKWCEELAKKIYFNREDEGMMELYGIIDQEFRKRRSAKKTEDILSSLKCVDPDIRCLARQYLEDRQKLDDISDAMAQCQAFKMRHLIGDF